MQQMIDQAQDEASLATPDGRFYYVNDAKCRSLGYSREELLSGHIWDVDPDMTPEIGPGLENLKEKGYAKRETRHRPRTGGSSRRRSGRPTQFPRERVRLRLRGTSPTETGRGRLLESRDRRVENVTTGCGRWTGLRIYLRRTPGARYPGFRAGKSWERTVDFMTPEEAGRVAEVFKPIFDEQSLSSCWRTTDRRNLTVETNGTPLFADDGRFVGYMGVDRDITDRKRIEKSLKLTQFTMDRAGDMVLWVAPDSRFIYVNEAACRTFGYTREEMIAMTAFDTCPSWTDESWAAHWKDIKERGSFTFEASLRKKDGSFFPGEISVNYLVYDGKEYNCSFIRDITDRKRAEEALKESEEKFRVLAETTRAGILLYRGKKVVYVNPALEYITGYGKDEMLGMNYWDMVDTDQKEMVRSRGLARQQGRQKLPSTYELKIRTKAGEMRWAEISAALISYHGRQTGLATIFDITDRKRSEEELHDAKGQAELYLDLMGHDINNLNQIGIGFLEMALATLKLDRESRELIARPLEAIEASSRLIGNVRKLQKIREGGLKFKEIRIADMLREITPRYGDISGPGGPHRLQGRVRLYRHGQRPAGRRVLQHHPQRHQALDRAAGHRRTLEHGAGGRKEILPRRHRGRRPRHRGRAERPAVLPLRAGQREGDRAGPRAAPGPDAGGGLRRQSVGGGPRPRRSHERHPVRDNVAGDRVSPGAGCTVIIITWSAGRRILA